MALQPAAAAVHPPEVERRLAFDDNDWTIEGSETAYRETCRWYHQRSFVVCETVDQNGGAPAHSVSILAWSAATNNYTYHHYAQNGRSHSETCFADELQGLTCLGERRTETGLVQSRSHRLGCARMYGTWSSKGAASASAEESAEHASVEAGHCPASL